MQTTKMVLTTSDGAELSVWSAGAADDEAVILLHGFSLDHTTWNPIAERLVQRGFRIVAPDLRGHGQSTLGEAPPTVDRLLDDIHEIASTLGLDAFHLVGHSLGAFVALAARSSERLSGSVKSVTSIAGTEQSIQNDPLMRVGAAAFSSAPGMWLLGRQRAGRLMISSWFGKTPSDDDLDRIRTLSAKCDREIRVAIAKATRGVDLRPSFAEAGPPTLVLCGREDKAPPLKHSQRIAGAIAGAELAIIDHAGHMVMIEQPETVTERLAAFLRQPHLP